MARVCPTRGCTRVIPYEKGTHERHRHGSVWRDALNVWVFEKVRAFYLSLRNNRVDPLHQAPRAPVPSGKYTPRFLGTGFFDVLAEFIFCCREHETM